MKIKPEELDRILKQPGYRARDQSAPSADKVVRSQQALAKSNALAIKQAAATYQPPKESKLERRMVQALAIEGMPPYQRNYFFLPDRDFELDIAWAPYKVGIEVQGMAHRVKSNFMRDIQKRALAQLAGWIIVEVDRAAITSGQAVEWTLEHLRRRGAKLSP